MEGGEGSKIIHSISFAFCQRGKFRDTKMLDNYITAQETVITAKLDKIAELESAIAQLRKEIRLDEQLKQARVTASSELTQWLEKGKELLGDMAGIFPIEFLDDVKTEIGNITDEIKDNFHNYDDNGNRFLTGGHDTIADDPITPMTDNDPDSAIDITPSVEVVTDTDDHDTDNDHDIVTSTNAVVITPETDTDNDHDNNGNGNGKTRLTPSELAKRLGLKSHHELTQNFKGLPKNAFIVWTCNTDPDGVAWYKVNGKYEQV